MGLTKRSANVPQIPKSVDSGVPNHLAHKVTICHPGYNDASDDLISFPAFDGLNGGLYFDTALIACGIITGNNWDGSFSKDIKGKEVISHESCDGILPPGLYYFHLPAFNDKPYPVVPSFRHWLFPHRNLPSSWTCTPCDPGSFQTPTGARSDITVQLFIRDNGKCRMSYHEEGCEMARLCPKEENQWFHQQRMERYIRGMGKTGDLAVDDINNRVLLRADLHKTFDDNKFVFVPKDGEIVVHMLELSSELTGIYHNSRLHTLESVPREYLFARFAWAIFPFIGGFLQASKDRWLLLVDYAQPYLVAAEESKTIGTKKRSQAGSPKKNSSPTKSARIEPNENELENEEDRLSNQKGEASNKRTYIAEASQDDHLLEGFSGGLSHECNHPVFESIQDEAVTCDGLQFTKGQASSVNLPSSTASLLTPDITPSTTDPILQPLIKYVDVEPARAKSSPERHTSSQPISDPMQEVEQDLRLRKLHHEALLQERKRSDRTGLWQKELDWADEYLGKSSADVDGMQRLGWIYGSDIGVDR